MSKKLSIKQKNWLLIFHLFFISAWLGGGLRAIILTAFTVVTADANLIYPAHLFSKYFDWFLVIPGAAGTLITGVWLSLKTNWGLTKYYWIIIKLTGNIAIILFGGNFMRFWLDDAKYLSANDAGFLQNPVYLYNRDMLLIGFVSAVVLLILLLIISIIKPWGKRKSKLERFIMD
ncbi:MAG: DUF2269 domain-containing protein [Bacillota bacterium]